jgi:hypothetical protein
MVIQDMVERVRGAWDSERTALGLFTDLKKAIYTGSSFQNWGFIWRVDFSMWYTTGVSQVSGWLGVGLLRVQFGAPGRPGMLLIHPPKNLHISSSGSLLFQNFLAKA